ncbi:hypothetical protein LEP1GSC173_4262 [Leptospira interrogans str. HAI1594]|uniref:Uncharacterized protein n=2 Tax=Leptospira interrogans TaxID=173 RepID=A0AAQ1NY91_LEPIR|nr:hypothetical protein G436_3711 [Leptospira interrogans serovar Hardjo str. Norma]EKP24363.1 hypothetical protein LEP1GSC117_1483 [Leptospira interrogans serovar Icterohaemorrhagiae str. Verdun LP]EKP74511.1 hypothetical protein LEP1GSC173_4262 [Leptospira interrogans str. HAI1594]EMO18438.1 hypothetical protein LEP1GSC167_1737 [Leptospira interrogans serovar Copenhageni str. HAI0188]EMO35301.1 hypothetical protein LEP1GSC177_4217 [Leptospira interrogans str. MMD3731]EMY52840.1 hypothetical 
MSRIFFKKNQIFCFKWNTFLKAGFQTMIVECLEIYFFFKSDKERCFVCYK